MYVVLCSVVCAGGEGVRGGEVTGEMRRELDAALKELRELRERKSSLERECVIYQSQLEVCISYP